MQERRGWDVYYIHRHFPDSVIHGYLPLADPSSPAYTEETAEHADRVFEMTFRLCDRLVGGLVALADRETTILTVADHGNRVTHHSGNVMARLASRGLVALDREGNAEAAKSPVVLRHANFRWQLDVNPAVVPPEKREETVDRVIEALRRHHAALLGLWGPEIGDVVFFYADGCDWWGAGRDPVLAPHGVWHNGIQFRTGVPTLGDMPQEAGFRTGSVGKVHLNPWFGEAPPECFEESRTLRRLPEGCVPRSRPSRSSCSLHT
jgi:arylsulfatase A-like enzyme